MMLKPARVLFGLLATASTLAVTGGSAHAAQGTDIVQATPAPGSHLDPHSSYYVLTMSPGQTVTQKVTITNPNSHAVLVDIGGVDAGTSGATGASYGTPSSQPKSTGEWITFVTDQLQLQPDTGRTVPFTISVPSNVGPGQYLAGVSAAVPLDATHSTVQAQGHSAKFNVTLEPQRILAVEVDVPGPRQPHLAVTGVRPVVQGDTLRLQFAIKNSGNAFAKGSGSVTVPDTNTRDNFSIDTFVSHTSIEYGVPWTKNIVPGTHTVTIRLVDQTGRIVTWSGAVDVSGAVGSSLQHTLAAAKGAHLQHHGGTSPTWIAWLIVPICIAGAVHLHRRRGAAAARRNSGGGPQAPRGVTATPPATTSGADRPPTPTDEKLEARASR
jgi:hypothetical protein